MTSAVVSPFGGWPHVEGVDDRRLCPVIEGEVQFFLRAFVFVHADEPTVSLLVAPDQLAAVLAHSRLRGWRGYHRQAMADLNGGGEVELVVVGRPLRDVQENILAGKAKFLDWEGYVLGRIETRFRSTVSKAWTPWWPLRYGVLFAVTDRQFEKCNGDFATLASEYPPRITAEGQPGIEHQIVAWPTRERPTVVRFFGEETVGRLIQRSSSPPTRL
jgi:hypothetical protein